LTAGSISIRLLTYTLFISADCFCIKATPADQSTGSFGDPSTIGSRIRKRRRTGDSPVETNSKVIKTTLSQSRSPELHRVEAVTPQNSLDQQQEPFYLGSNGNLDQLTSPTMDAMDSMDTGHLQAGDSAYDSRVGLNDSDIYEEIIHHAETTEKNYYDQHSSSNGSGLAAAEADSYVAVDASLHLKIQSLPILDNLLS